MIVHLIVMGMSGMGIALGLQAAQVCHFPNFITKGIKTKITFIDEDAEVKMKTLKTRLPSFFDEVNYSFCDYKEKIEYDNKKIKEKFTGIDLEFIKARFEDDETRHYLERASGNNLCYLTIAVALRDPCASLSAALYLPAAVFDSQAGVLVRQEESHAIVSLLTEIIVQSRAYISHQVRVQTGLNPLDIPRIAHSAVAAGGNRESVARFE